MDLETALFLVVNDDYENSIGVRDYIIPCSLQWLLLCGWLRLSLRMVASERLHFESDQIRSDLLGESAIVFQ